VDLAPVLTPTERLLYLWRLRWRLMQRSWKEFFRELLGHPVALVGGVIIIIYLLGAIFAPQITVHDPTRGNLRLRFQSPAWLEGGSWEYPLGTDAQGRDLLTRIIYGARISLLVGFLSVSISVLVGGTLGALAGYYRGRLDAIISRLADLLLAFPFLIFAIGVMAFMGPGFTNLILALTFKGWVEFFRVVRGEMMAEKTQEYVEAGRVSGLGSLAIIVREILPNIIQSVFVLGTLRMGDMIIMEASLSFLGLGILPPLTSWGALLRDAQYVSVVLQNPWLMIPGAFVIVAVLCFNFVGDGLRDAIDPFAI